MLVPLGGAAASEGDVVGVADAVVGDSVTDFPLGVTDVLDVLDMLGVLNALGVLVVDGLGTPSPLA